MWWVPWGAPGCAPPVRRAMLGTLPPARIPARNFPFYGAERGRSRIPPRHPHRNAAGSTWIPAFPHPSPGSPGTPEDSGASRGDTSWVPTLCVTPPSFLPPATPPQTPRDPGRDRGGGRSAAGIPVLQAPSAGEEGLEQEICPLRSAGGSEMLPQQRGRAIHGHGLLGIPTFPREWGHPPSLSAPRHDSGEPPGCPRAVGKVGLAFHLQPRRTPAHACSHTRPCPRTRPRRCL